METIMVLFIILGVLLVVSLVMAANYIMDIKTRTSLLALEIECLQARAHSNKIIVDGQMFTLQEAVSQILEAKKIKLKRETETCAVGTVGTEIKAATPAPTKGRGRPKKITK